MEFRAATPEDHPILQETFSGEESLTLVQKAWVTKNEQGPRYWVAVLPYAFGQYRIQLWFEKTRREPFPEVFFEW